MHLKQISISNFKNLEQVNLLFSPYLNCFVGNNGEGKTNLLDAINYLSITKSFFNTTDQQNICHTEKYFMIQGHYDRKGSDEKIYCGVKAGDKKVVKRNDKEYTRFADHVGLVPIVMISPTDVSLIVESGDERRRYLNGVISQSDAVYLESLIKYNRVLLQRNKLLKQTTSNADIMGVLNEQLNDYAKIIYTKRKHYINDIQDYFAQAYNKISGEREQVSIEYKSDLAKGDFLLMLEEAYEKDSILQHTSLGIHRDDIIMKMGDYNIKKTGSQGQQKSYLIALKLAQFNYLKKQTQITPILLLDDIFDKLDLNRVERLIELVSKNGFGQIFLTDSNKTRLDKILAQQQKAFSLFEVKNGNILNLEN